LIIITIYQFNIVLSFIFLKKGYKEFINEKMGRGGFNKVKLQPLLKMVIKKGYVENTTDELK